MAKRIALSSAQARDGIAADLVALLQSITSDGRITTAEIKQLHRWLRDHSDSPLPGMTALKDTIERICDDGKITDAERTELSKVIERVLPPELRSVARQRRIDESGAARERRRLMEEAEEEVRARERARTEPSLELDFLVAGVAYERRSQITSSMQASEAVYLIRDRVNRFSPNAIEVRTQAGHCIGYVPEELAAQVAADFDAGARHIAWVKRIWPGRRHAIPIIIAEIYPPETERHESIRESQVPAKRPIPSLLLRRALRVCIIAIAVFSVFAVILIFVASTRTR